MPHVFRASQVSEAVCLRVIEVTALLRPPQSLLSPWMMATVLRTSRQVARTAAAQPVTAAAAREAVTDAA